MAQEGTKSVKNKSVVELLDALVNKYKKEKFNLCAN
jgi:hypothetical protein